MHHGEVHTSSRDRFVARRPLGACAVETQTASLRCDRGNTVTDGWSGAFKFEDFVDGCEGLTAHEEVQSRSLMVFVEEYPVGSCASVPRKSSRECTNGAFGEWVDDREYGETFSLCSDGCGRMRHGDETATQVVMYEAGDVACSPVAVYVTERCVDGELTIDDSENTSSLT